MFLPRESRPRFKATRNFLPPPRGRKRYFIQENLPELTYSVLQDYNITPYRNERLTNIYSVYQRHKNSNDCAYHDLRKRHKNIQTTLSKFRIPNSSLSRSRYTGTSSVLQSEKNCQISKIKTERKNLVRVP